MHDPVTIETRPWTECSPSVYLDNFYACGVSLDEEIALSHLIRVLRDSGRRFENAIEFGCGPTLLRAIAVAPYVSRMDMVDLSCANLQCVRNWVKKKSGCFDWRSFTRYVLKCEGLSVVDTVAIDERENATRRIVREVIEADARVPFFFTQVKQGYDLLVSGFGLECVSREKDVWHASAKNALALLRPGGRAVVACIVGASATRVGDAWFPACSVDAADVDSLLLDCGFSSGSIELREVEVPTYADYGWEKMLIGSAEKE